MLEDLLVKSAGSRKTELSCTALLQHELRNKKTGMLFEHKSAVSKPRPAVTLDTEGVTRWNGGWGILLQVGPDAWLMTRRWMLCSSILMCLGMSWLLSSLVFGACQNKLIVWLRRYAQPIRRWGLCKLGGESSHFAHNRLQWCSDSLLLTHTHTQFCVLCRNSEQFKLHMVRAIVCCLLQLTVDMFINSFVLSQ